MQNRQLIFSLVKTLRFSGRLRRPCAQKLAISFLVASRGIDPGQVFIIWKQGARPRNAKIFAFRPLLQDPQSCVLLAPHQNEIFFILVPSRGIEPLLQDPQSCVLSVERRGEIFNFGTGSAVRLGGSAFGGNDEDRNL